MTKYLRTPHVLKITDGKQLDDQLVFDTISVLEGCAGFSHVDNDVYIYFDSEETKNFFKDRKICVGEAVVRLIHQEIFISLVSFRFPDSIPRQKAWRAVSSLGPHKECTIVSCKGDPGYDIMVEYDKISTVKNAKRLGVIFGKTRYRASETVVRADNGSSAVGDFWIEDEDSEEHSGEDDEEETAEPANPEAVSDQSQA